ncbi:YbaB/EbfC family nucleoid-associated protein [Candidatus Mycoplasma haematobovis]|nr:YbaB/EbfC family nucleoid-associated protein [Candidatus Mycoplasma haematobovis]
MLQKLLADARKSKELFDKKMSELEKETFSVSIGGGLIEMAANGRYEITSCTLNENALADKETLEDLIITATNDLIQKINAKVKQIETELVPKKAAF